MTVKIPSVSIKLEFGIDFSFILWLEDRACRKIKVSCKLIRFDIEGKVAKMPSINNEEINALQSPINRVCLTGEETEKPEEAQIEGKLPSYLKGGKYLRAGPGKFDFDNFTVNHLFDGHSLLSKFEFKESSIILEKKYLESDAFKKGVALGKPAIGEFNTRAQVDEKKGIVARVISNLLPEITDNSYSNLFQAGSDIFVTCDSQFFHRINANGLNIMCKCDTKALGLNTHCAHPLTDENGDMYNIGLSVGATGAKYNVIKMPFANSSEEMFKKTVTIASIAPRWSGTVGISHSFGMTQNYLVFIEQPHVVNNKRVIASFIKKDTLYDWLEWRPQDKNRFYLVTKSGKVLKTEYLSTKAFYFTHMVNCYEENDEIIVDILTYDSPSILETMLIKNLREDKQVPYDPAYLQRFILPIIPDLKSIKGNDGGNLVTKKGTECTAVKSGNKILISGDAFSKRGYEMPMINKKNVGKKYRFLYTAGSAGHEFSSSVCKIDLETKEIIKWSNDKLSLAGEPYFIPDPEGDGEDDGVILTTFLNKWEQESDILVVLDAKTFQEVGRAKFRNHLPMSLHGLFLSGNEIHK